MGPNEFNDIKSLLSGSDFTKFKLMQSNSLLQLSKSDFRYAWPWYYPLCQQWTHQYNSSILDMPKVQSGTLDMYLVHWCCEKCILWLIWQHYIDFIIHRHFTPWNIFSHLVVFFSYLTLPSYSVNYLMPCKWANANIAGLSSISWN